MSDSAHQLTMRERRSFRRRRTRETKRAYALQFRREQCGAPWLTALDPSWCLFALQQFKAPHRAQAPNPKQPLE